MIDFLKTEIIDRVQASDDADLLDLILRLLSTQRSN